MDDTTSDTLDQFSTTRDNLDRAGEQPMSRLPQTGDPLPQPKQVTPPTVDEEILTYTASDEALEAAAVSPWGPGVTNTDCIKVETYCNCPEGATDMSEGDIT